MARKRARNKDEKKYVEGMIRVSRKGDGFLDSETYAETIHIEHNDLNTALDKDVVRVLVGTKRGNIIQGSVEKVLVRQKLRFVGQLKKNQNVYFIEPDDQKMYADIIISSREAHRIGKDKKAVVEITKWDNQKQNPVGKLLDVLGVKGRNETEMQSIVIEKGFDLSFPKQVERAAEKIETEIQKQEIEKRRDMRQVATFTIDPETAKDFDDAISYQELPDGNIEVGIHSADVTHYVPRGSEIDKEAARRGTSIYLVDRTIPMLPEILSNGVCSLRPKEDKLAFSAVFVFSKKELGDGNIKIVKRWFGKTVIHSDKRFSYEEAQSVLDEKGEFKEELESLNKIAKLLRKKRTEKGSIAFSRDEVKFELDEKGRPIDVYTKETQDTNRLIEDFMLLANRSVAHYVSTKDKNVRKTFVYRVHDVPNQEKMEELQAFLKTIGYHLKLGKKGPEARDVNKMLEYIRGRAEEDLIQRAAIRAMAKAVYSTKNIGHFGLSFTHYTHFTSPIRRYPDMMVHRLLETYLSGNIVSKKELKKYEAASRYASAMEQSATEAERDSIRYKQIEYMKDKVGKTFSGVISGVTSWGLYVEEEKTHTEGLVHVKTLGDDFYELDEKKYALVGEKTKKRFQMGDTVRFKITGVDLDKRTVDMELI